MLNLLTDNKPLPDYYSLFEREATSVNWLQQVIVCVHEGSAIHMFNISTANSQVVHYRGLLCLYLTKVEGH